MTLRDYVTIIRRKWAIIVVCALMAAAVAWLLTPANPPAPKPESYTATATLLVETAPPIAGQPSEMVPLGRLSLYVKTGEIPVRAAQRIGYEGQPALLASQVTVEEDSAAAALKLTVTGSDGKRVADIANAFAEESVAFFATTRPGAGDARLSVLQQAVPIPGDTGSSYVIPPGRWARTLLAGLVGLVLGFALAMVLHQFDSRLRTRDEVQTAMGLPIVAEVPRLSRSKSGDDHAVVAIDALSPYADAYRVTRAALTHTLTQRAPKRDDPSSAWTRGAPVILVTSAHAGEGKTTSVANLAASFSETGQRVLVLDADFRSPDTHNKFDVPQGAGASDYLLDAGRPSLEALIRPTNVPHVGIITAGTSLTNPTALAGRTGALLAEARQLCDVLIVDSAPMLEASDVFDILPMADTVLLVVRSGRLTEMSAKRSAELLRRFHIPVAGVVLVGVPRRRSAGYGYGYGAGYGSGKKAKRPAPLGGNSSAPMAFELPTDDHSRRARRTSTR